MKKTIFIISIFFLNSCGQKGDLYLPEENSQNQKVKTEQVETKEEVNTQAVNDSTEQETINEQ